ncbi:MAG: ATP-dependent Clp protease ATP-binding subunit [Chloroflexi bacterium]|nr:ATP-dependent Clp protease ATP-binding subunit [Chloroflexota bacterium]
MSNKFDRFTKKARQVLTFAQEEAQLMNHGYIGTEHLLLGLVREQTSIPAKILSELGVDLQKTRDIVEEMVGKGKRGQFGRVSLTPRTKRVIELAVDEARRMGHHYIGPEHLLLGLVREGDGIAADVLQTLGLNLEKLRGLALQQMKEMPAMAGEKAPAAKGDKKNETPLVDQLGTDVTAQAQEGQLDPVIGRKNEIERVIQILSRRRKNNPALIGEPGIGKTAIVEGLAQRIVSGNVPENLLNKRVVMLDVGSLVAGTIYRGQFEERLKRVIDEIKQSKSILFIDEVHMLVGAGAAGSSVDAANILKPALARGELQCIGATTLDEYRKHIESDPALERRFQPIHVEEPSIAETIQILRGVRERYEAHHNLKISDEALESAANLAARYIADRFMPDKAIDLIDEASARVRLYRGTPKKPAVAADGAVREKDAFDLPALDADDLPIPDGADDVQMNLGTAWDRPAETPGPIVSAEDIAEVVSMWTGVPVTRIAGEESARLLSMESDMHHRVVGQEDAIKAIARAVRRSRAGLKDPKRPIGSFVFLGPTGVGKTEVAKALAELLFGSEQALIKLDMSEYQERHTVSRMIGAPPGYVGFDEGGQLTEMVRRRPYSVVLLDEIEKAHPDAFNVLLQVMEDGQLTDGKGRRVDFRNTIIIMTSNVGADLIKRETSLGFTATRRDDSIDTKARYDKMKDKVLKELKDLFRPEFLNRVDSIVVFSALTRDEIKQIVDLELSKLRPRLLEHQITLSIAEPARELLAEKGYDPAFGARPLKRLIQSLVEDPLSEGLLSGKFRSGDTVLAERAGNELDLQPVGRPDGGEGQPEAAPREAEPAPSV